MNNVFRITLTLLTILLAAHASALLSFGTNHFKEFQRHAPADTVFYVQGNQLSEYLALYGGTGLESAQLQMQLLEVGMQGDSNEPFSDDFTSVISFYREAINHYQAWFVDRNLGLHEDSQYALYLDGLAPVLQVAVERNSEILATTIQEFAESHDYEVAQQSIGDKQYSVVELVNDNNDSIELAWYLDKNWLTVALISNVLSEQRIAEVLGMVRNETSLGDSGKVGTLATKYNFASGNVGYFDVLNLTSSIVGGEETTLRSDLERIADGEEFLSLFPEAEAQSCQQEFTAIAALFPRLVFGSQHAEYSAASFDVQATAVFEIADADIRLTLESLNGHFPSYLSNADNLLMGFGVGLNGTELTSVLNEWWARFTNAEYECTALTEVQVAAMNNVPAEALMATATLSGLKGFSFALFDVNFATDFTDITSFDDFSLDALISLHADKAMNFVNLVNLTVGIPDLMGISEGKPRKLPIPNSNLDAEVLVTENHAGIYVGETAKQAFADVAKEPLNEAGSFAMAFNYSNMQGLFESGVLNFGAGDYYSCLVNEVSYSELGSMEGHVILSQSNSKHGIESSLDAQISMLAADINSFEFSGNYVVETLDESCRWNYFGEEALLADNSGYYAFIDEKSECEIERFNYSWSRNDHALDFVETSTQYREKCKSDWVMGNEAELTDYTCQVYFTSDNEFRCAIVYEDSADIYRYLRD